MTVKAALNTTEQIFQDQSKYGVYHSF